MSGLVPFNRHGLTSRIDSDFANMIDDFFGDYSWPSRSLLNDTFKMDITEDDKAYYLEAEMPGVKKKDISLNLNDGHLTVTVTKEEKVKHKRNILHRERRLTSMTRSVYLRDVSEEGIQAKLEEGVLYVKIPKTEAHTANGKKIPIE